jgi:hypothetical protein
MSTAKKTARRILFDWCAANGIVVEVTAAADLVARIEAALKTEQGERK